MKSLINGVGVAVLCVASVAQAETWTAGHNGKADFYHIQDAIEHAVDFDTIVVFPGHYDESLNTLGKRITVRSAKGAEVTTITGADGGRALYMGGGETELTVIQGFTIRDCNQYGFGGAVSIRNGAAPKFQECAFINNVAGTIGRYHDRGGAISIEGASAAIVDCMFSDNFATSTGGAIAVTSNGHVDCVGCSFHSNSASFGGAVQGLNNSSLHFESCTFEGNFTEEYGGAIYASSNTTLTLNACVLRNNQARFGGGVRCQSNSAISATNTLFDINQAYSQGGGVSIAGSESTFSNCSFSDNDAVGFGTAAMLLGDPLSVFTACGFCGSGPDPIHGDWEDGGDNTFVLSCTEGVCCSNDACVLTSEESCALFAGEWRGLGTMCETEECIDFCPMDIDGDGLIGVNEILWVLDVWGPCP